LFAEANGNKKEDASDEITTKIDDYFSGIDNAIYSNTLMGKNIQCFNIHFSLNLY